MTDWYLFRFNQVAEGRVLRGCKKIGVEALCPHVTEWKKRGRDRKERPVTLPAWAGYLLVGTQRELPLVALLGLHTSIKPHMMTTPTEPALAKVRLQDIQRVKNNRLFSVTKMKTLLRETRPDPKYGRDEMIRIIGGAESGLKGRILDVRQEAGTVVADLGGLFGKTEIAYERLERLEEAA